MEQQERSQQGGLGKGAEMGAPEGRGGVRQPEGLKGPTADSQKYLAAFYSRGRAAIS